GVCGTADTGHHLVRVPYKAAGLDVGDDGDDHRVRRIGEEVILGYQDLARLLDDRATRLAPALIQRRRGLIILTLRVVAIACIREDAGPGGCNAPESKRPTRE